MEDLQRRALDFVRELATHYFESRDMAALEGYLEDGTSWIGSGRAETAHGRDEVGQTLTQDTVEYGGRFTITQLDCTTVPLHHSSCVSYGTITAVPEDDVLAQEDLRFTAVTEHGEHGDRLLHLHCSHPDILQEPGHLHVPRTAFVDHQSLRSALDTNLRLVENLTQHIPGGMHQCANDSNFTLLSVSDGFLSMFGYTRQELQTLFGDRFLELIHPEDRETVLRCVQQQLQNGPDTEVEYRILRKDGQTIWVLDKGRLMEDGSGEPCFYCLLVEINDRKQQQEALRLSLERHKVIMDQATDIIFEWDIRRDALLFSQNWRKKFGYDPIDSSISDNIPLSHNIHPEDMPAFVKIMRDTAAGVPYSETEFRIRDVSGTYLWCRIRATTQYDADGRPIKAVGVIVDIDGEKRQKQVLLELAQRDMLTGLYNKSTITGLVEQQLRCAGPKELYALVIMDVDHFKSVNDRYGHLCGDSILSDVAATIKSHLGAGALAGRIGGDEFMIFLSQVDEEESFSSFARSLCHDLHLLSPEEGASPITCSMGVAVSTYPHQDLNVLFKQADMALYHRKNNGRRGFTIYDPLTCSGEVGDRPRTAMDDLSDGTDVDDQMAHYAFRTLYRAQDIESTIQRLLEIFGRSNNVSRAYIFEATPDMSSFCNTFEWCAEGVAPQKAESQHVHCAPLSYYQDNFDDRGIFFCPDVQDLSSPLQEVLAPLETRSMLQCAMLDQGRFVGYIGFDECNKQRLWTRLQVSSFKLTADVLSTFLLKLRQRQQLDRILAEDALHGDSQRASPRP